MSLQATANLLQQQGRNDDKMLVHMTPREVAGLEAIARAKGGSLTINPKTGLPEAGFLDDVLPIAASAALMYFGGPMGASIGQGLGLSGALAQGVGMGLLAGGATTLLTGDLNKGLQTGLTAGVLSGGMSALSGPSTVDVPTANVETTTPALQAAATEATAPNAFTYNAAGEMVPANYPSQVTGATNMPPAPNTSEKSWWGGLSGKEKLATGLAGATGLSLLGGMQDRGVSVPTDKGTIRPYEYSTALRPAEAGKSQFFEPIQYDVAGRPSKPIDTSERTYFTQGFKALPTYAAANGGEVPPNLERMPAGGLAAIQGMRDGYAPMTTSQGEIPQFANGGEVGMANMQYERAMPDQFRDATRMRRMAMLEGSLAGDEQAKLFGGKAPDFTFMPGGDLQNMNALAMMNKDLTEDTELKLMALGYKNPEKSGIANIGAGLTKKLGKDADLSAYYEQSPDSQYKAYGARFNKRFAEGGYTYDPKNQKYSGKLPTPVQSSGIMNAFLQGVRGEKMPQNPDPMRGVIPHLIGERFQSLASLLPSSPANTVGAYLDETGNRYLPKFTYDPVLQRMSNVTPAAPVRPNPVSVDMAEGGHLGDYSDGGRLLKGPGDGVSDSIPASINNKQPARLADGEFVIPARIVSELGNGSTDAGAKRLYDMMDRIQADRKKTVGKGKVAVDSKARKHLPA